MILENGEPAAEFVYGSEELKPYLHVFGEHGERLTEWSPEQRFPHHRGIFIGWNRVQSELGSYDLWHLRNGGRMKVAEITEKEAGENEASFTAAIEWHGGKKDEAGSSLLIREERRFTISRPAEGRTRVDVWFELTAARDLRLNGDLQHSGIHFRAAREVSEREEETSYVWAPPLPGRGGKVESRELKWARLIFPLGENWYSATELNAPGNPVEELSWRDYGRFGFFFKKELEEGETLKLRYRFVTEPVEPPEGKRHSGEELQEQREEGAALYEEFVEELKLRGRD